MILFKNSLIKKIKLSFLILTSPLICRFDLQVLFSHESSEEFSFQAQKPGLP